MKAILVIDMPKDCGNCPCVGEEFGICQADEKNRDCDWYKTPSWCPLKPMPEKKWVAEWFDRIMENNKEHLMSLGWNDCIDEILGEEK